MAQFDLVLDRVQNAKGIAWDTCHKIYVLMDESEVAKMREYGYDPLITSDEMSADEMYRTVVDWYDQSCGLRFISAVSHPANFEQLIEQFESNYEDAI